MTFPVGTRLVYTSSLFLFLIPASAVAQPVAPKDGSFYIKATPVSTFKATLLDDLVSPNSGAGVLRVFAPALPELPAQGKVSTRLFLKGKETLKAKDVIEENENKRRFLALEIPSESLSPKTGIPLRLVYEGTLNARTLIIGKSPKAVPDLTEEDRHKYLLSSKTMDHNDPEFIKWLQDQKLKRRKDEQVTQFAHRIFTYCVKNGTYGGDTSSYEARKPTNVCKSLKNDCGGHSLLFVAIMRANDIPARTLFGRWAIPQTDDYGQYHVIAEFFVPKSGWVPVDIAGTIVHKPIDPNAMFGSTDGRFITFHIDTDVEPVKGFHHGWAQYLLIKWEGTGDFWKDHKVKSKWEVEIKPYQK